MAQAQINSQIATLDLSASSILITAEMGFTRLIVTSLKSGSTITGTLPIGINKPKATTLPLNVPIEIGNGSQVIDQLTLTGNISIIAFQ